MSTTHLEDDIEHKFQVTSIALSNIINFQLISGLKCYYFSQLFSLFLFDRRVPRIPFSRLLKRVCEWNDEQRDLRSHKFIAWNNDWEVTNQ